MLEKIFTTIYDKNYWEMGQSETKSGLGSTLGCTASISKSLLELIEKLEIKNMLDVSCGEWNWMRLIKPRFPEGFKYTGLDIVASVVDRVKSLYGDDRTQFIHSDMLSYMKSLPDKSVDLILCRHTFEHLREEYTFKCINEMKRVAKFSLITTHRIAPSNRNLDYHENTYRPVNLDLSPYVEHLGKHLVKHIYDGAHDAQSPEAYIILYYWG